MRASFRKFVSWLVTEPDPNDSFFVHLRETAHIIHCRNGHGWVYSEQPAFIRKCEWCGEENRLKFSMKDFSPVWVQCKERLDLP